MTASVVETAPGTETGDRHRSKKLAHNGLTLSGDMPRRKSGLDS
jgi:hypothetical protein